MMRGKKLPIGSVVLLKNSTKRVMVIGFIQRTPQNPDRIYDYCGCLYPEGYIGPEQIYLFDEEQIDQIYSVGYMDEEQFQFERKLDKVRDTLA